MDKVLIFLICAFVGAFMITIIERGPFGPLPAQAQQNQNTCKIYYDKAKELAEKGAEDLPSGGAQIVDFDPRVAKSNASIAYSQIYKNCREYDEN